MYQCFSSSKTNHCTRCLRHTNNPSHVVIHFCHNHQPFDWNFQTPLSGCVQRLEVHAFLTKVVRKCQKIISPILIRYFWTCHQVQILDWKPGFCKSADFIGQNEKKSKNQHQKINIPSSSVFWFGDCKVLIQRKK